MPTPSLYYLTHNRRDKRVHSFPKSISSKVNLKGRMEFELTDYDVAVEHANHDAT